MSCKCKECECNKSLKTYDKWKYTLLTTVIFIIVVSPKTYQLTNMLLSGIIGKTASKEGCPTVLGLFIHAIVFTIILRYIMDVKI
jgi:hypothetical protein